MKEKNIISVIEFGCGDGNQLTLANYQKYIGVDVSQTAIDTCNKKFLSDKGKIFITASDFGNQSAELTLSLDVIYHLIEDKIFHKYMRLLFDSSEKYVIIYSSNYYEIYTNTEHVKHRKFTDWIYENIKDFSLVEKIPNKFPYSENEVDNTSFADFYIFEKKVN